MDNLHVQMDRQIRDWRIAYDKVSEENNALREEKWRLIEDLVTYRNICCEQENEIDKRDTQIDSLIELYRSLKKELEQHEHEKGIMSETDNTLLGEWLPSPSLMPSNLAPAQMIECDRAGIVRADKHVWARASQLGRKYRFIYSDSGLPMCSSEGLRPETKYVATDPDTLPRQFTSKPTAYYYWSNYYWSNGTLFGGSYVASFAHCKPGPWRDSLMEVMR